MKKESGIKNQASRKGNSKIGIKRFFSIRHLLSRSILRSSGFTILYSVLVTGLLLSIGISIYNISIKEYILSSSTVDSQYAIYAADTGIECARYWDWQAPAGQYSGFATPNDLGNGGNGLPAINCNDHDISLTSSPNSVVTSGSGQDQMVTTTFTIPPVSGTSECAIITVTKEYLANGYPLKTVIESRGYNYCDANPRKVERAFRVLYPVDANGNPIAAPLEAPAPPYPPDVPTPSPDPSVSPSPSDEPSPSPSDEPSPSPSEEPSPEPS